MDAGEFAKPGGGVAKDRSSGRRRPVRFERLPALFVFAALACVAEQETSDSEQEASDADADLALCEADLALERTHTSPASLNLSVVTELEVDSRGRVFVEDGYGAGSVTVLSPALELLWQVGREGEGPGEFKGRQIQILEGDSLAVYDWNLGRTTVFSPDSFPVVRTFRPEEYGGEVPMVHWVLGPDRSLAWWGSSYSAGEGSDADEGRYDVVASSMPDGAQADTVLFAPSEEVLVDRGRGYVSVSSYPFGTKPLVRPLDAGRFVYVHTGEPRLWILGLAGDTVATSEIPSPSLAVTRSELDAAAAGYRDPMRKLLLDGAPYRWPFVLALVVEVGDDPRVWVRARGPSEADQWPVHVYDSSGGRVADACLAAGEVLHAVRGGFALTVSTDSLGVPRIHKYRLSPPLGALNEDAPQGPGEWIVASNDLDVADRGRLPAVGRFPSGGDPRRPGVAPRTLGRGSGRPALEASFADPRGTVAQR